jgi:hypothetical protein
MGKIMRREQFGQWSQDRSKHASQLVYFRSSKGKTGRWHNRVNANDYISSSQEKNVNVLPTWLIPLFSLYLLHSKCNTYELYGKWWNHAIPRLTTKWEGSVFKFKQSQYSAPSWSCKHEPIRIHISYILLEKDCTVNIPTIFSLSHQFYPLWFQHK